MKDRQTFNYDHANLADQLSCAGELEHAYMHFLKTAATLEEDEAVFYLTMAEMTKNFRREFMREHFPDVKDQDWCLVKCLCALQQRIYESCNTSHKDLKEINSLWATTMEHIFGIDMSDCATCRADREKEAQSEPLS